MRYVAKTVEVVYAQPITDFQFSTTESAHYVVLADGQKKPRPLTHGWMPKIGDYYVALNDTTAVVAKAVFENMYVSYEEFTSKHRGFSSPAVLGAPYDLSPSALAPQDVGLFDPARVAELKLRVENSSVDSEDPYATYAKAFAQEPVIDASAEVVYRDDLAVVENVTFDPPLTVAGIREAAAQLLGVNAQPALPGPIVDQLNQDAASPETEVSPSVETPRVDETEQEPAPVTDTYGTGLHENIVQLNSPDVIATEGAVDLDSTDDLPF